MDYTFSGFTAGMPKPIEYFHQIIGYIPDTLDFMVKWLNEPIVIIMLILCIILGFIFALLK